MFRILAASLMIAAFASAQDPAVLVLDTPLRMEIPSGSTIAVGLSIPASGELCLWAVSADVDPAFRVVLGKETIAEAGDSRFDPTAFARFRVAGGAALRIELYPEDETGGAIELMARLRSDSERARELAKRLAAATHEVEAKLGAADQPGAAATARRLASELEDLPAGEGTDALDTAYRELAIRCKAVGALSTAAELLERLGARLEYARPANHPDLIDLQINRAEVLKNIGREREARVLEEAALAALERRLRPDADDILDLRLSLASTVKVLGENDLARSLEESVLAVLAGSEAPDEERLRRARINFSSTLFQLGDLERAAAEQRGILDELRGETPPDEDLIELLESNYAATLTNLKDYESARLLQERVLARRLARLPGDDQRVQFARRNLAITLKHLGRVEEARDLEIAAIRVLSRYMPADAPDLLLQRLNYAQTLMSLGDHETGKGILEDVLSRLERLMPPTHVELQRIRVSYSVALALTGDVEGALELQEKALEALEKTLPAGHPAIMDLLENHAGTLRKFGDDEGALEILEEVLAHREATLSPSHPDLQGTRLNVASLRFVFGRVEEALAMKRKALAAARGLRATDDQTFHARTALLLALGVSDDEAVAAELTDVGRALARSLVGRGEAAISHLSSRQVSDHVIRASEVIDQLMSFMPQSDDRAAIMLGLIESNRILASRSRRLARLRDDVANDGPREAIAACRRGLTRANQALEEFMAAPTEGTMATAISTRMAELAKDRDEAERELLETVRMLPSADRLIGPVTLEAIAGALPEGSIAVSYREYDCWSVEHDDERRRWRRERRLAAHVLERDGAVTGHDLGPVEPVRRLVAWWRARIGAPVFRGVEKDDETETTAQIARRLRRIVLDPIRHGRDDITALIVVPSDTLQVVPLDALNADDSGVVGDEVVVHAVSGLEWLVRTVDGPLNPSSLVGFGDIDYLASPTPPGEGDRMLASDSKRRGRPAWRTDFRELPESGTEVKAIARSYSRAFPDAAAPRLFLGGAATEECLEVEAPRTRFLHLATHGWFAPQRIPSIRDVRAEDAVLGISPTDLRLQVKGFEPFALCGVALAGANLEPDEDGRRRGLVDGREIAALDLSGVELATLSACSTSVGVERSGQGMMSLQQALAAAGVRRTLTSLWDVPSEATMILMARFYEGIWRRGESASTALWNAKKKLRETRDPRSGRPRYREIAWAAWVLTGAPE